MLYYLESVVSDREFYDTDRGDFDAQVYCWRTDGWEKFAQAEITIEKINEITKFPPTVESFSLFIGISHSTYNKWLVDSDKLEGIS